MVVQGVAEMPTPDQPFPKLGITIFLLTLIGRSSGVYLVKSLTGWILIGSFAARIFLPRCSCGTPGQDAEYRVFPRMADHGVLPRQGMANVICRIYRA